jgi:molecular chaperone GrpE (heat shock protein)
MILDSQSIVVAYDPDRDDPQLLALVYQLVKMNSLANSGNLEDLDVAEVNKNIEEAVTMLGQFDSLQRTAASIENAGKKLKSDLKDIRAYVLERLANVKNAISESLEPEALEFGYNLELEAPEED